MLKPVERDNLSSQVFRQLRDDILSGEYRPGDRLPSERELCDVMQVNRSCVREALKRLEQARLIDIRHGGGSIVLDFLMTGGFDLLRDMLMPAGRLNPIAVRSALEVRTLIGDGIARYCAARVEEREIVQLERIVSEIEALSEKEVDRFYDLDFEFHYVMARASRNVAFSLMMNSIRDLYFGQRGFFMAAFIEIFKKREVFREIVEALKARDEERSRRLYSGLIENGNRFFRAIYEKQTSEAGEEG